MTLKSLGAIVRIVKLMIISPTVYGNFLACLCDEIRAVLMVAVAMFAPWGMHIVTPHGAGLGESNHNIAAAPLKHEIAPHNAIFRAVGV